MGLLSLLDRPAKNRFTAEDAKTAEKKELSSGVASTFSTVNFT
jgi:hypothetical protein